MSTRIAATALAVLGGALALLAPNAANAANVGYYGQCYGGTPAAQITAAGHTPVAITALDSVQLAGISMLFAENCGGPLNVAPVNDAVSAGMILIVHDNSNGSAWSNLPGNPALIGSPGNGYDVDFTAAAAYLEGPGGILDNTSLDNGGASNHGAIARSSLPAGAVVSATTADPDAVITFSYSHGSGSVLLSTIPLQCYLPGGTCFEHYPYLLAVSLNMQAYATNLIACALDAECAPPPPATTCASEGYTGAKLTWCQNVCEKGYTGAVLNSWIHRWVSRYRDLPYCAVEDEEPEEELPPQND